MTPVHFLGSHGITNYIISEVASSANISLSALLYCFKAATPDPPNYRTVFLLKRD